jgi:5'-deoxynucleotidase
MRALPDILRGGYCTRWHAHPDLAHIRETLAAHHARVAQIIFALHPAPSLALIDAALHHDCGEPWLGDVTGPAKRNRPDLAKILGRVEAAHRAALGLPDWDLSPQDRLWLEYADRRAALAHVSHVAPHLLTAPAWRAEIWRLADYERDLDVAPAARWGA